MTAAWASRIWAREGATLRFPAWLVVAPVAGLGIVVLGTMAVYFSPPGAAVSIWWPAAGLSLALAVVTPRRQVWATLAIVFVAVFLANSLGGHGVSLSLWYAAGNTIEAAVGALILTSGHRRAARLVTLEDTARLLMAALGAAATLGVIGGVGIAFLSDGHFLASAQSLTASHMAAHLIIVPAVIAASSLPRDRSRRLEAGLQFALLLVVSGAAYLDPNGSPTVFLPMPFLIWGALRLTTRLVSFELLLVGIIMVVGTHEGRGPFGVATEHLASSDLILLLQASILVNAMVAIPAVVAADQRRAALRHAQTTRDELRSVLDSSQGLAIVATNLRGDIVVWGAGAAAMFGYSRDEAIGSLQVGALYADPASAGDHFHRVVSPLDGDSRVVEGDWEFIRKDSTVFTGHLRLSLRRSPSGENVGYLGVIEDVSQSRKTEEALRAALRHEHEAVERLAALDRSKNDFIASVSHELRTPITSVIGYTDLMRAYDLPDEQRRLLEPVVRNAKRLEHLIEDLLTLSRMDGGTFAYRPAPLDLRDVVRSAVESVLVAQGQRRVEFLVDLGDSPIPMMGDAAQLERAVSNLVTNAIKFTPDGGRATVGVTRDGRSVDVTVTDTGIGIPKAEQGKVFDRFFRSSTSEFLAIDGTGLGLHIVNQVVSAHGGRVTFESAENEGSTFTIRLPLRQA